MNKTYESDEWPDWIDVGKKIHAIMKDGAEIRGRLTADELFNGEDEVPVFMIETKDGEELSFCETREWVFE